MALPDDDPVATAAQYLIWAIEEIERAGDQKAAHHARMALEELRSTLTNLLPRP